MKLLFDENISHRLPGMISMSFPGSAHVRDSALRGAGDEEIWRYARENDFTVVSKDSDFYQRVIILGSPPKLVWLRVGNCTTAIIRDLLMDREADVRAFGAASSDDILILT